MPDVSGVLDLAHWKWSLPEGSVGKPVEVQGQDLTASTSKWLRRVGNTLVCSAPVNGVTTPGSKNPRSEGRQVDPKTGKGAAWQPGSGWNSLTVLEAFTKLPDGKPEVVGAQIHNATDDVSVWRLEGTKLWITNGNDDHWKLADGNYRLGTPFLAQFIVAHNIVYAYYQGGLVGALPVSGKGFYFKAGAYVQANCSDKGVRCAPDNVGEVTLYNVKVESGTGQAPAPAQPGATPAPVPVPEPVPDPGPTPTPDPVPTPVPSPTVGPVVMVIRHGEGGNLPHTLDADGLRRAALLPTLFLPQPKPGLYSPTAIYASEGKTASLRPLQTVQPLAAALHEIVVTTYDAAHATTLGKFLSKVKSGVHLVAWAHQDIAALTKSLGKSTPKPPKSWSDARYDMVLVFKGDGKGNWTLTQVPEMLLPGDQTSPIK
jgi:hypothetical protein